MAWMRSVKDWDLFYEMISPRPGDIILDVGAGKGAVARRILSSGASEVHALEPDSKRVAIMKKEAPGVKSCLASAEEMPFPDSFFSKVYTTMAVHHFSILDSALNEVARVLKPGGTFLILDLDPSRGRGRLMSFLENGILRRHHAFLTRRQLTEKLRESSSFEVVRSEVAEAGYMVLSARKSRG